jgi:hypothetical protein
MDNGTAHPMPNSGFRNLLVKLEQKRRGENTLSADQF